jgi:hypothetical protein
VPGNGHAGCGRRLGETHRWKHRQGAPGRPHFYLLEAEGFTCWLLNAKHVKNAPGRPKTDLLTELRGEAPQFRGQVLVGVATFPVHDRIWGWAAGSAVVGGAAMWVA